MPDRPAKEQPNESPEARARTRALRLLAHRERSRRGCELLLARAGFAPGVIRPVLDELEARGLLSDRRYCRLYLGEQSRSRPRSVRLLRRDLLRAGVDRETADQAIAEAGDELSEEALALAAARKKLRTATNDPARLSRLLRARGFSPGLVRRTLAELLRGDPTAGRVGPVARDESDDARDEDP